MARPRDRRAALTVLAAALSVLVACSGDSIDDTSGTTTSTSTSTTVPAPVTTTAALRAGVQRGQLLHHGVPRRYRLYIPPVVAAHPEVPVPLLVGLHGATGNGEGFAASTGFDVVARRERFVVVYPDGRLFPLRRGLQPTWNAGRCCGISERLRVDDVGFVAALIAKMQRDLPIDRRRTFVAGHSNGAMLAFRLVCERPELVAAAVAVAGGLEVDHCTDRDPAALLAIHGDRDPVHPLAGGPGGVHEANFRSFADSVRIISEAQRCGNPEATEVRLLSVVTWPSCRGGTTVASVVIHGAGHEWPPPAPGSLVGGATGVAWRFLESGALPG